MSDKKYIYESSDGGKTVYRYEQGKPDERVRLINVGITVNEEGLIFIYES